ncbi:HotDog domain-containing protein [Aspergillus unguis]
MASLPRSLPRLLRKQAAASIPKPRTSIPASASVSVRTAQTHATPALKSTPPPPSFSHQHASNPTPPGSAPSSDILTNHPILQSLRRDPSLKETRPHLSMPSHLQPQHFVAGTLSGETKLSSAPYMFLSKCQQSQTESSSTQRKSHSTTIFHTGTHMCGHPGYIHGGFLSVMFDEVFAHCVSQSFPSGTGMTANLNVDFRKPALPNRVYVLQAETVKVEGRKAWVEGALRMMPANGMEGEEVLVAEARALFVEPKFAESMEPVYRN